MHTKNEQKIFMQYAEGTFCYNMYQVALAAGMRVGELCGLMWNDIDFENKVLYVRRTRAYFGRGEDGYVHELYK